MGLAFVLRLLPVLNGGGLYGLNDYDDGVYFGAAVALVHGSIPYRDFLLLHPPGILYVLAPFAALGNLVGDATAFAAARLAFMLLGAANAGLVALVAGRIGRRAALFAGVLYAVWPVAANVERTTWLIAPQNTLLLLGPGRDCPVHGRPVRRRRRVSAAVRWPGSCWGSALPARCGVPCRWSSCSAG